LNPIFIVAAALLMSLAVTAQDTNRASRPASEYNVRTFGAKGDGKALDTDAVNRAIDAAAAAGGGTVWFPAGSYLCFSIHLKSHVALYLDEGATIVAASPVEDHGRYDAPEANAWSQYQDFGHSHWHNSLIWGEGVQNVSIVVPENPVALEIIELRCPAGVGFCGHV